MMTDELSNTQPNLKAVVDVIDNLNDKQKKYIIIGLVVLTVVLLVIALIVYLMTGNEEVSGGIGAAAVATTAAALQQRNSSRSTIASAKEDSVETGKSIADTHDEAVGRIEETPEEVSALTDPELAKEGNDLFGDQA